MYDCVDVYIYHVNGESFAINNIYVKKLPQLHVVMLLCIVNVI